MHIRAPAIICAIRPHGENGAVARVLTEADGLLAGYVRGGRSRRLRPVLIPGNLVMAELRARTGEQMPGLTVELMESRARLLGEPLPAAAIEWTTVLAAVALPEGHAYRRIYAALGGILDAIAAAPSARGWAGALVRYERLVLAETGFGFDEAEEPTMVFAALRSNGRRIAEDLLTGRRGEVLAARDRLLDRLKKAMGVDAPGDAAARGEA